MQNVKEILEKINQVISADRSLSTIDIDLMLDYTRKIYDALLEKRMNSDGVSVESDILDDVDEEDVPEIEETTLEEEQDAEIESVEEENEDLIDDEDADDDFEEELDEEELSKITLIYKEEEEVVDNETEDVDSDIEIEEPEENEIHFDTADLSFELPELEEDDTEEIQTLSESESTEDSDLITEDDDLSELESDINDVEVEEEDDDELDIEDDIETEEDDVVNDVEPLEKEEDDFPDYSQIFSLPPKQPGSGSGERDIRKMMGINDRIMFLNDLFKGDKEAFDTTLEKLNEIEGYNEALDWITGKLVAQYNWSDDNEAVLEFYDLVSKYFRER